MNSALRDAAAHSLAGEYHGILATIFGCLENYHLERLQTVKKYPPKRGVFQTYVFRKETGVLAPENCMRSILT